MNQWEYLRDISERVARVETLVGSLCKKVDGISKQLAGNGDSGLQIRVDRLEGSNKRMSRVAWTFVVGAIALLLKEGWTLVGG